MEIKEDAMSKAQEAAAAIKKEMRLRLADQGRRDFLRERMMNK